jgi:hypothetical protein
MIIGILCTIPIVLYIAKTSFIENPLIWGVIYGIFGIFILLVAYKTIQPPSKKINEDTPFFGEALRKLYAFSMISGMSGFLLYASISAFQAYWFSH